MKNNEYVDNGTKRVCRKCSKAKLVSEFTKNNHGTPTRECKTCANIRVNLWVAANKERAGKIKRRYVEKHPRRSKRSKRKYYVANRRFLIRRALEIKQANRKAVNRRYREQYREDPEKWVVRQRRWKRRNRERCAALSRAAAARRRKRVEASASHYTADDVLKLLVEQNYLCAAAFCRKSVRRKYHVDHIVPLFLGGSNEVRNIQILCPSCNLRKNRKHPDEWLREAI